MKEKRFCLASNALAFFVIVVFFAAVAAPRSVQAAEKTGRKLEKCLKRALRAPDEAVAEAESWMKKGGGDGARLCRAHAQFHRGEYALAAAEFAALAAKVGAGDRVHVTALHVKAGLSYSRANDHVRAEEQYSRALAFESQDPEIWVDRAAERASIERYWDAIDDLNRALTLMPDMTEALRMRGQALMKLGQDRKAWLDFQRAEVLDRAEENYASSP